MADTKLIRDHHLLTRNMQLNGKYLSNDGGDEGLSIDNGGIVTASSQIDIGNMSLTTSELDISSGDLTLDVAGDIILDAAGDNVTLKPSGALMFDFSFANGFRMSHAGEATAYMNIKMIDVKGSTSIITNDPTDANEGHLVFQPEGNIVMQPIGAKGLEVSADTKTASSIYDATLTLSETLNMDSGADGSDVHHGIRYTQTQTDLTGWDTVYLMYIDGGTDKILHIDNNANLTLSNGRKVVFGDAGEYITGDGTDLTIVSGGKVLIDKDIDNTTGADNVALYVDFDRTGDVSSGTDVATGIEVEVDHTGASDGTITSTGVNINVTGDSGGTSIGYGVLMDLDGADTCYGLYLDVEAGTASTSRGIYLDNTNGGTDFKNVSSVQSTDCFTLNTIEDGETTLTTSEAGGGSTAHLNMVADGDFTVDAAGGIYLDAENGECRLTDDSAGSDVFTPTHDADITTKAYVDSVMYDHRVCNYYSLSASIQYVPLSGYIIEGSLLSSNEYRAMVMPYDGSLIRMIWRSEVEQTSGTFTITMIISSDGTEIPGTTNFRTRVLSFTLAANTTYVHDPGVTQAYDSGVGNETNAFSKGQIIAFGVDPTVAPQDTNCTLVFKYDTST